MMEHPGASQRSPLREYSMCPAKTCCLGFFFFPQSEQTECIFPSEQIRRTPIDRYAIKARATKVTDHIQRPGTCSRGGDQNENVDFDLWLRFPSEGISDPRSTCATSVCSKPRKEVTELLFATKWPIKKKTGHKGTWDRTRFRSHTLHRCLLLMARGNE